MKPLSFPTLNLFLLLLIVSSPFAQTESIVAPSFPYLVVSPQKPIALTDTVKMQIMLGTASNSCEAPTFNNVSFVIKQSMLTIYPPLFTVEVKFTLVPLPTGKVCPDVYNPVDYGPIYKLGVLKLGSYQVTDGTKSYGGFSVGEGPIPIVGKTLKGRIYDDPYPDKRASRPIPNVKVFIETGPMPTENAPETPAAQSSSLFIRDSTFTDSLGVFGFTKLSQGIYYLTCSHKEFRTITKTVSLRSDTAVYMEMVSTAAFAAVEGTVTVAGAADGRIEPLEGCIIVVNKSAVLPNLAGAITPGNDLLSTMTDKDGKYAIDSIPISANGEIWYVHAFKGERYSDYQKVSLYNWLPEKVDFRFVDPYQNRDSVVLRGIVFRTATDKYSYRKDEPVKIRYSITNTTEKKVTFGPFDGACEYNLTVSVIPTIAMLQETPIYRLSDQALICYDTLAYINVEPRQTVNKNFPDYYLPSLTSFAPLGNKVMLSVSARLRGATYDSTQASVLIEVRLDPTAVSGNLPVAGRLATSCAMQDHRIALNLIQAQNVSVDIYSLDGKMHPNASFTRHLPAGAHTLSLMGPKNTKGIYLVSVKGADFEKKFSVVNVKN